MRILAIERSADGSPGTPSADDLRDEAARAWELQQAGSLREIYLTDKHSRAVILLECANAGEAATIPLSDRSVVSLALGALLVSMS